MFFRKKEKPITKFTSLDGRANYDSDYLMITIEPTKEEITTLLDYSKNVEMIDEFSTQEEKDSFENELTRLAYDLFVSRKNANFHLTDETILVSSSHLTSQPIFVCSFLIGGTYDLLTNQFAFLVNPIYYHNGSVDFDLEKKENEEPILTKFQILWNNCFEEVKEAIEEWLEEQESYEEE